MRIDDVHFYLSQKAADIANANLVLDQRIPTHLQRIYRPLAGHQELGLTFSPALLSLPEETVAILQQIGKDAVTQALRENPSLFGNLIVESARKGDNYFDRYD